MQKAAEDTGTIPVAQTWAVGADVVLLRRAALPAAWSGPETTSPRLNGEQNVAGMETGIPSFELTGVSHMFNVTCLTPDTTVSPRLRGSCLLLGLATRNTSEITYEMFGRSRGGSRAHSIQPCANKSNLSITLLVLILCCKDPKHLLVQNEKEQRVMFTLQAGSVSTLGPVLCAKICPTS